MGPNQCVHYRQVSALYRFDKKSVKISVKPNITQSSLSIIILGGIKDSFLLIKASLY